MAPTGETRSAFRRAVDGYQRFRAGIARNKAADTAYRVMIGVVGLAVVVLGLVALPAPGPGWAIIFVGLGILATEFESAQRVLAFVRRRYEAWVAWLGRQNTVTRLAVSAGILLVVAVCAWLVGAFALVGGWFGIRWAWLQSPLLALFG